MEMTEEQWKALEAWVEAIARRRAAEQVGAESWPGYAEEAAVRKAFGLPKDPPK